MRVGQTQSAGPDVPGGVFRGEGVYRDAERNEQQARALRESDRHSRGSTTGRRKGVCEGGSEGMKREGRSSERGGCWGSSLRVRSFAGKSRSP